MEYIIYSGSSSRSRNNLYKNKSYIMNEATKNSLKPVLIFSVFVLIPVAIFALLDKPLLNFLLLNKWLFVAISWCFFAHLSGVAEAHYYHLKIKQNFVAPLNEHIVFNFIRFFVWFNALLFEPITAGCLVFLFSLPHDGAYFLKRNKLSPGLYRKGWFSSKGINSTALLDLPVWLRLPMFIAGVIILFLGNEIKW